ncbi:MAG: pre-mRNA-splicing factor cwc22, partial [Paramarteilia canceri]
ECGDFLEKNSARAANAIFERLRSLLYEADIPKRSQYMIEVLLVIRRDKYEDYPSVKEELQLIDKDDQYTHQMNLEEEYTDENQLNIFRFDPEFEENERKYDEIKKEILDESEEESEEEEEESEGNEIEDNTEMDLTTLRRTIYLTINSSLDCDECVHKMMKLKIKSYQFIDLARMIVDSCVQLRSYEKFFGFVVERICFLNSDFSTLFAQIFSENYAAAHLLETIKIRNMARFYAHLLSKDSISWSECLGCIKLTEHTTTSSQRILLKILMQELSSNLGLDVLKTKLFGPEKKLNNTYDEEITVEKMEEIKKIQDALFPKDEPRNSRFAVNFFTAIDLGPLT